ncbi:phosphatidylglycerophosphatase A family protein [Paramaledivibacter caminithermalis]|uniref:Phosphatidylglycerophosphatase A n=2 Tax=Paramaledivibacter TaxID=1884934 RepID=A0A1M6TAU0_PARC5|nr:phosphatidylglycerophosphatase A [Paramaledivibacter caminithermalis]SHK53936.1 Phosphatidylglycerophosphatase A [Paramaledivibacter caminithermalis DSM 15212]
MKNIVKKMMLDRGVKIKDIANLVFFLQSKYCKLDIEECIDCVDKVLEKREVQHAILTGIALDILAEQDKLEEPLLSILKRDESLYGIDEILALSITNIYGSIGLTNFGYLDKEKIGILKDLNVKNGNVHTFLDDLVAGIAAAASAKIAHSKANQ